MKIFSHLNKKICEIFHKKYWKVIYTDPEDVEKMIDSEFDILKCSKCDREWKEWIIYF